MRCPACRKCGEAIRQRRYTKHLSTQTYYLCQCGERLGRGGSMGEWVRFTEEGREAMGIR